LKQIGYNIVFVLFLIWLALLLPPIYFDPEAKKYLIAAGAVAAWRYTWLGTNVLRALFYKKIYFPKIRKKAQSLPREKLPEYAFILVTTYRIPEHISIEVYRAAIREVINCVENGMKATLVASVVEKAEENLVRKLWKVLNPPKNASLVVVRFAGTGKRDGLAVAFRTILREPAKLKKAVVALVDGDSILTKGTILKCAELFALYPKLGAVTTDEDCYLEESNLTYTLYKQWYKLRFAQRDIYMSSASLSRRVQTLTGRMSVYRGVLFLDPEFTETVQHDFVEHWRIGWLRFLTGDDKSTWYYVLKKGWEMLYVPDALVWTHEDPPSPSFFKGATMLMVRWFGNSLRATYRAMKIPVNITTLYMWYLVRDQRITMWTGLYGLLAAILGEIKWGGGILFAYLWWILFTRYLVTIFYGLQRGYYYMSWPFLLYFNQIYGSLVKIFISSHLYKQKWTRQKTVLAGNETKLDRIYVVLSSHLELFAKILVFFVLTGFSVGFFEIEDIANLVRLIGRE
jgi:glycosyltransferase Alg8